MTGSARLLAEVIPVAIDQCKSIEFFQRLEIFNVFEGTAAERHVIELD